MPAPPLIMADPESLPEEEWSRAALSLYWRRWSYGQIAEELGLKYDTVKSWPRRAAMG